MLDNFIKNDILRRTKIFIDYDNLYCSSLGLFNRNIQDIGFFPGIHKMFDGYFKILDISAFANFDSEGLRSRREHIWLEQQGVRTFNCATSNKNSTDATIIIEAMKSLYEQDFLDVYVFVTNDRDFVPLIQHIRSKNKQVILICSRSGTNTILPNSADEVLYIEDMFKVEERKIINSTLIAETLTLEYDFDELDKALYLYKFMLKGGIFKGYLAGNNVMSVNGFATFASRNTDFTKNEVIRLLMICAKEKYFKFAEEEGDIIMTDFKLDAIYQK